MLMKELTLQSLPQSINNILKFLDNIELASPSSYAKSVTYWITKYHNLDSFH